MEGGDDVDEQVRLGGPDAPQDLDAVDSWHAQVENDGPPEMPGGVVHIQCAVTIDGDSLSVDFTGTTGQVNQAINVVPTPNPWAVGRTVIRARCSRPGS